jgi:hypothetical protein
MNFFGGRVKLFAPCCKILWHVKNSRGMNRDTYRLNLQTFLVKFLSALLLGVSAAIRAENSGG